MTIVLTSVVSLAFGLAAWALPVVALCRRGKNPAHGTARVLSAASLAACAVALCAQLYHVLIRVNLGDWAGLMDTIPAVVWLGTLLLIVTITLNAICAWIDRPENNAVIQ